MLAAWLCCDSWILFNPHAESLESSEPWGLWGPRLFSCDQVPGGRNFWEETFILGHCSRGFHSTTGEKGWSRVEQLTSTATGMRGRARKTEISWDLRDRKRNLTSRYREQSENNKSIVSKYFQAV